MENKITLTKGERYEAAYLRCIGWTDGDGSGHDGYHWLDYFDGGIYAGPDSHGIEPICEASRAIRLEEYEGI